MKDVEAPGKTCVSIDEWVDVWGILVGKAKKMDDFPMWLQYYPKVLFDVINRSGMRKKKENRETERQERERRRVVAAEEKRRENDKRKERKKKDVEKEKEKR